MAAPGEAAEKLESMYETAGVPDRRRAAPGERKAWEPATLQQQHHEILAYKLLGYKSTKIAEIVGMTETMVSLVINSELGKEKLALMRVARDAAVVDVPAEVKKMMGPAMQVYERILNLDPKGDDKLLRLQLSAADSVVKDLGGHTAPKKFSGEVNHNHSHLVKDSETLQAIVSAGRKAAAEAGLVIDAEFEPVQEEGE